MSGGDRRFTKAAVIGAGSMGSGLAAQFANAGIPVVLLDLPAATGRRNAFAEAGVVRQQKAGGFMHPDAARLVTTGNIEDGLHLVADADWIIEAIAEDIGLKRLLYARLDSVRRPGSAVSSNTSTIPLSVLTGRMPESFARDFVITHFFNPPRHMQLMELVVGPHTDSGVAETVRHAADIHLGKSLVECRDTPGFIANRLGCYWLSTGILEAVRLGLDVEDADAIAGAPFGVPRTGIFGLMDLVGVDLIPNVWGSLLPALPAGDAHKALDLSGSGLVRSMLAKGLHGRKADGGFYRVIGPRAAHQHLALDLETVAYRPRHEPDPTLSGVGLRQLCERQDAAGAYAWRLLSGVVCYAAEIAPQIANDLAAIDTAVELGYNWKRGPFALADTVGANWLVSKLRGEGRPVPRLLKAAASRNGFHSDATGGVDVQGRSVVARKAKPARHVCGNQSAALWDIGDGVAAFKLSTKMNAFSPPVLDALEMADERVGSEFRAMVIATDHPRAFSVGADLTFFVEQIGTANFDAIIGFARRGQLALQRLKFAPFPVVGAAAGIAMGAGCEILLHCSAVVAHAEFYAGLPETKVGIVPGWGGCVQLLLRASENGTDGRGPVAAALRAFETISDGRTSGSAAEARDIGLLRSEDEIVMNRAHLLETAKRKAIALSEAYAPPQAAMLALSGGGGYLAMINQALSQSAAGKLDDHGVVVRRQLATVLSGGQESPASVVSEISLYEKEIQALNYLLAMDQTDDLIKRVLFK